MIDECRPIKIPWTHVTYVGGVRTSYLAWHHFATLNGCNEHLLGAGIVGIIMSYGINRPEYTMPILKHHENLR